MKRSLIILCVLMSIGPNLDADREKSSFKVQSALNIIRELAANALQGRRSGQTGGTLTEAYIAAWFKKWGLTPAGDGGSYYQNLLIPHRYVKPGVKFVVKGSKGERTFIWGEDFRVARYSGSAQLTAEVIFSGYGLHAPEKGYDDYAGIDVRDRLVMFAVDIPKKLMTKHTPEGEIKNRILAARQLGASGVVLFQYQPKAGRRSRIRIPKQIYKKNFPMIIVEPRVREYLFKDMLVDSRYVFRSILKDQKPQSCHTGQKIFISVSAGYDPQRPCRNVLAKIPGAGPFKNEYVIVGAHMDHLGINPDGEVMNGANDNASGTAVTMELARALSTLRRRRQRTIIFALWAAEEQGLLGSNHYASHATHPLQKTAAYFNLDMVGHGNGQVTFAGRYYAPHVWDLIKSNLPKEILSFTKSSCGGPGGSDHTPFLYKGIPAFSVQADGFHVKYHHSRDDADIIKPMVIQRIGDTLFHTLQFTAGSRQKLIRTGRQERFQYKYQYLIDYQMSAGSAPARFEKGGTGDVDVRLVCLDGDKNLSSDALRSQSLTQYVQLCKKVEKDARLRFHTDYKQLQGAIEKGHTSLLLGLKGSRLIEDDPGWLEVLAPLGLRYVWLHSAGRLLAGSRISDWGQQLIRVMGKHKLLLMAEGLSPPQMKTLLRQARQQVALLVDHLPGRDILDLVKKKGGALGLVLQPGEGAKHFFAKLDEARKKIGIEHLFMMNRESYSHPQAREKLRQIIVEMLKAQYKRAEISNLFSTTFFKILEGN